MGNQSQKTKARHTKTQHLKGLARVLIDSAGGNKVPILTKAMNTMGLEKGQARLVTNQMRDEAKNEKQIEQITSKMEQNLTAIGVKEIAFVHAKNDFLSELYQLYSMWNLIGSRATPLPPHPTNKEPFTNAIAYHTSNDVRHYLEAFGIDEDSDMHGPFFYLNLSVVGNVGVSENSKLKVMIAKTSNAEKKLIASIHATEAIHKQQTILADKLSRLR